MRSYKESMNQIVMPDALKERIRRQVAPDARQAAPDAWQARRVHRRWYTVCANMAACLLLLLCTQMRLSDFLIPVQDAPANSIETASSTLPQTADTAEPPIDSAPKRASAYHNSAAVSPHLPEPAESAAADSAVFRSPAVSVYGSDTTPESGSFPADMAATAVESGNKPLSKETAETTDAPDTQKKSTQTTGLDSPPLLQSPPLSSSSAGGTVNGTGFTESIPATDASSATLPQTEQNRRLSAAAVAADCQTNSILRGNSHLLPTCAVSAVSCSAHLPCCRKAALCLIFRCCGAIQCNSPMTALCPSPSVSQAEPATLAATITTMMKRRYKRSEPSPYRCAAMQDWSIPPHGRRKM